MTAVAHTDKDDRIELSARVEDGHVILAVADSGCGIPEADLERIFGRFSRAAPYRSREVGGFGLGLPTAAAIAEAHHGSVRVSSTVGKGSTFELLIPAGRRRWIASQSGSATQSGIPSHGDAFPEEFSDRDSAAGQVEHPAQVPAVAVHDPFGQVANVDHPAAGRPHCWPTRCG